MPSVTSYADTTRGAGVCGTPTDWREAIATAIRCPKEFCRALRLPAILATAAEGPAGEFPLLVPRSYLARVRPGDSDDPLLLQVLPRPEESLAAEGFSADPLGEGQAICAQSLLKKYHGRALLVTTGQCAIHCRFCFRRHFPFDRCAAHASAWAAAADRIADDRSIREVILSGGDPLMLDDAELAALTARLAAIDHVRRLRIHTRMPIVIPQRVTAELLGLLRATRLAPLVVVHVNHPAELAADVASALARLVDAGVPVFSQSVLLRGVNDRLDTLEELCQRLADLRVTPYYLHQLDRVAGAAHFEVPVADGRRLIEDLRARLPGYAVPCYVRETAGGVSKTRIA